MGAAVIVLAGGAGSRTRLDHNKVYAALGGRSVLSYSLETCEACPAIDLIVLVIRPEDEAPAAAALGEAGVRKPVSLAEGGPTRTASELAGLDVIKALDIDGVDVVAIHDGARPFATAGLFSRVVSEARRFGGAIPGRPVDIPMLWRVDDVYDRIEPGQLARVQTPQAFRLAPLLLAYDAARAAGTDAADTADVVQRHGQTNIVLVPGDPNNMKITHPGDLSRAGALATAWAAGRW